MRVLVAFDEKEGGTRELASWLKEELAQAGHEAELRSVVGLGRLGAWDAVIVGGGLYAGCWDKSARRFVQRHINELAHMPVWFFSVSLWERKEESALLPPLRIRRLMSRVKASGYQTFRGCVCAKNAAIREPPTRDDQEDARAWGRDIAARISPRPKQRQWALLPFLWALCFFWLARRSESYPLA